MDVMLVEVNRNINRAVRTCYSFGIKKIYTLNCAQLKDNLFSATGRIEIVPTEKSFLTGKVVALEVNGKHGMDELLDADYLIVGGESTMLKVQDYPIRIKIPTANNLCLTTEAALAIALYYVYAAQS